MRPVHCLFLLLVVLLLNACGGPQGNLVSQGEQTGALSDESSAQQEPGTPGLARSLPAVSVAPPGPASVLPKPDSLTPRSSTFTVQEGYRDGAQFDPLWPSSRVVASSVDAVFSPDYVSGEPLSEMAFALYSFNLPDAQSQLTANMMWTLAPSPNDLFIGLANFDTNRWDWIKPGDLFSFELADSAPYLSATNDAYVAIALSGNSMVSLHALLFIATAVPEAVLESDTTSGLLPLAVTFDAGGSSDSDGSIADFEWDFDGDGNFNEADNGEDLARSDATPSTVTYSLPGVFNATVRVTDNQGAFSTAMLEIAANDAPQVTLEADVTEGEPALDVAFTANATDSGSIEKYEWDFDGDGNFNEADNGEDIAFGFATALATYPDFGGFTATVRVTDNLNATATADLFILVGTLPTVELTANPESGPKPLEVDFTTMAADNGTIEDYEWDFDGDGLFNEADNAELGQHGVANPTITYSSSGSFNATVRVTDDDSNTATDSVTIDVSNAAPTADLQASVTQGEAPLLVDFDASGSSDPDGSIADYEWDLDGDGTYNETGEELDNQGMDTITGFTFTDGGTFTVFVRATDDEGASDVASVNITVTSWTVVTLVSGTGVDGTNSSMALINGNPAVAFRRSGPTANLRYMRSTTQTGASASDWSSSISIASGDVAIYGTSLAQVGARICVAYQYSDGSLRMVRDDGAGNFGGPGSGNIVVDNTTADTGRWPSLKVVGGNPAIGYTDMTSGNAMYVRSSANDGATGTWTNKITVFDGTIVAYTDMQLINGNPALTFCDNSGQVLKFIRSTTANGDAVGNWPAGNMCDVATSVLASYCGLTTATGNPAIGYIDANADLRFARCSTASGTNTADWTAGSNVAAANQPAITYGFSRVGFVLGSPAFAYSDVTNNDQLFCLASNVTGDASATWNEETVDGSMSQMAEPSNIIVLGNGQIAFTYHNIDTDDLMYAIRD